MVLKFLKPFEEIVEMISKINEEIEKVHPKVVSRNYLSFVSGKISFSDLSYQIEKGLFFPNWDMLSRPRSNLRPLIFLTVIGGLDKEPKNYVKYASMLEMIHNGTLIHDDIEDSALIRRGDKPTYMKFGVDFAVNSANLLYFSPFLFFRKYPLDFTDKIKLEAYNCLIEHLNRVTWGQAVDIYWHNNEDIPSVNEYFQMCCYKTGAIDRMVLSLASIITEQCNPKKEMLEDFGEKLGILLQIHDDFSDICSVDRGSIGNKTIGNDISEGKKSLVTILALNKLDSKDKEELLSLLKKKSHSKDLILRALSLIDKSYVFDEVISIAKEKIKILKSEAITIFNNKYSHILVEFFDEMLNDFLHKYEGYMRKRE